MDATSYLLFDKIKSGADIKEILFILFLLPLIPFFTSSIKNSLEYVYTIAIQNIKKIKEKEEINIFYSTIESKYGKYSTGSGEYNNICHYLIKNNYVKKYSGNSFFTYLLEPCEFIFIKDDIFFKAYQKKTEKENTFGVILKGTKVKNFLQEIKLWSKKITEEELKQDEIIKHYVYTGSNDEDKKKFSEFVLSSKQDPCYQTFNHIFHKHKTRILDDLKRLKDNEYYKNSGEPRRLGYLFYGKPGTNKTKNVLAMALQEKRNIIEIPSSVKFKNEKELLDLFNLDDFQDKNHKNYIFLMDEIDTFDKNLISRPETEKEKKDEKEEKKLVIDKNFNLFGSFISKLDGVSTYNQIIFVATTNNYDKLDDALKRDKRLTSLDFNELRNIDIKDIIEHKFKINVNIKDLPDEKITGAKLKSLIDEFQNVKKLLKYLKNLK
jgi:hypothetical protein